MQNILATQNTPQNYGTRMSIYISHILTQPFFLVLPPLFLYHKPDYTAR